MTYESALQLETVVSKAMDKVLSVLQQKIHRIEKYLVGGTNSKEVNSQYKSTLELESSTFDHNRLLSRYIFKPNHNEVHVPSTKTLLN